MLSSFRTFPSAGTFSSGRNLKTRRGLACGCTPASEECPCQGLSACGSRDYTWKLQKTNLTSYRARTFYLRTLYVQECLKESLKNVSLSQHTSCSCTSSQSRSWTSLTLYLKRRVYVLYHSSTGRRNNPSKLHLIYLCHLLDRLGVSTVSSNPVSFCRLVSRAGIFRYAPRTMGFATAASSSFSKFVYSYSHETTRLL